MALNFAHSESQYVAKVDLQRDDKSYTEALLTMEKVKEEEVGDERDPKFILYFRDRTKGLVLNKGHRDILMHIYGEPSSLSASGATQHFAGKPILLYVDPAVTYKGKVTGGLRLRAPNMQAPVQPQSPQQAQPEEEPPTPTDEDYQPSAIDEADLPF